MVGHTVVRTWMLEHKLMRLAVGGRRRVLVACMMGCKKQLGHIAVVGHTMGRTWRLERKLERALERPLVRPFRMRHRT